MTLTWSCTITKEPEPDPEYLMDPVDWEATFTHFDAPWEIHVVIPGVEDEDAEIIRPVDRADVEEWLADMLKGLNGG
jgi:hypothetical protein